MSDVKSVTAVQEKSINLTTSSLAEKFQIADLSVNNGLICCTSQSGQKKIYRPEEAAVIADNLNSLAMGYAALKQQANEMFEQTVELAACITAAIKMALMQREESKGRGDATDIVTRELTPLKTHAFDWDGMKGHLDIIVEIAHGMFKDALTLNEVGDVIMMQDVKGEEKMGALKVMADYKQMGRPIHAKSAVGIYRAIKEGKFTPPSRVVVAQLKRNFDNKMAAAGRQSRGRF